MHPERATGGNRIAVFAAIIGIAGLLGMLAWTYAERLTAASPSASLGTQDSAPTPPADTRPANVRQLETRLEEIGAAFAGQVGIAVVDIAGNHQAGFNAETLMPQQSVSKLWVALTALDQADRGELDLRSTGTVRREDLTLFHQPIRKRVLASGSFTASYDEFMRRALVESDNTANDMLLKHVGGPVSVREILEAKGLTNIRFGPGERIMQSELAGLEWDPSFSLGNTFFEMRKLVPHSERRAIFDAYVDDPVDGASAMALTLGLAKLARGELLSPLSTSHLLELMRDAKSGPNRLKGGLPSGWQIAHKTGTGQVLDIVPPGVIGEQTGYNDIGILTAPDDAQYAVAVMIAHTRSPVPDRMDMMHAVVEAVAEYDAARAE